MTMNLLVVCLIFCVSFSISASGAPAFARLHFVPHSHVEPGAQQTFDEYFENDVRHILDGVIAELQRNDSGVVQRKFIWSEVAYFERWWRERDLATRNAVRRLVDNGHLEFVGGGWVQNDDSVTYYPSIINQVTLGHDFLQRELNTKPMNVWQVDSYGVSSLAPILWANFSWNMQACLNRLRGLVINRIDTREKDARRDGKMSFYWQPSRTLGDEAQMYTFVLPRGYAIALESAADIGTKILSDEQLEWLAMDIFDMGAVSQRRC
eukprot:TRINITY_DN7035_c0_g1_i3.p1 TRINITY_DN7035_c0_g1~~TRINITY_DN7035_c0_g1_i3.p1  ORF type:complete len:265 (-),score=67.81 TRINITY_DN7035_c0_g1_i3:187-981(-)